MTTTTADLLRAVLAEPDDDEPRLIFADWCLDHGEEARAELIRIQLRLHGRDDHNRTGRRTVACACPDCLLRRRARKLLDVHGRRWLEGFPLEFEFHHTVPSWERGFLGRVTCTAATWLARADALLAATPIRRVRLTTPLYYGMRHHQDHRWVQLGGKNSPGRRVEYVPKDDETGYQGLYNVLANLWPGIVFDLPLHNQTFLDTP